MNNIDASALKVLAKGRHRLPPPPVDGNPQITGRPQIPAAQAPGDAEPPQAINMHAGEQVAETVGAGHSVSQAIPAATVCPLANHSQNTAPGAYRRMDGRTMRKTGRTLQLATKVTPEFDDTLRSIAQDDGLLIVEVLEQSLDAFVRLTAIKVASGLTIDNLLSRLTKEVSP